MVKSLCSIAIGGVLALSTGAVFAQADNSAQQQPPSQSTMQPGQMQHGGRMMDPDQQLAHMTKALKLTADQQSQIKPILADRQQQMMSLHQDTSMARQDKMAKAKSINDDSHAKIEAVLNDEQKQKFEQMQAEHEARMQQHTNGGANAAPQSNPPQQ